MAAPTFSVIVPSERRRALLGALRALARQVDPPSFHVIAALDGPDDEFVAAATEHPYPFEFIVLEQSRQGLNLARDLGASAAYADVLVFVDEDTMVGDQLLAALGARHAEGAEVVQAAVTVHPSATPTAVTAFTRRWAVSRHDRLLGGAMEPPDVCVSPLSITHEAYETLRGDIGPPGFAGPGLAEDFRIGHGLNALGLRADYLADVSCMVTAAEPVRRLLARSRVLGRADSALSAAQPQLARAIEVARAARWVTSRRESKLVRASADKAERLAGRIETELMAEARRGVADDDALERLDRAVALNYWMGHAGRPHLSDRP